MFADFADRSRDRDLAQRFAVDEQVRGDFRHAVRNVVAAYLPARGIRDEPLSVRRQQNAEKEKKRIQGKSDWREFKRATFARLQEARTAGLTVAQIAAAYGALTENTVLDILNAAPRPIEDYRALAAALDKLAEI